jgi:hypothetical protein
MILMYGCIAFKGDGIQRRSRRTVSAANECSAEGEKAADVEKYSLSSAIAIVMVSKVVIG